MRLFAIDNDNTITAFPAAEQIPEGQEQFASDLKPVKKFTDRKSAVARIWKAIQGLDGAAPETATAAQEAATPAPKAPKGGPRKVKATKTPKAKDAAPTAREGSKKAIVLDLLRRKGGATLGEIAKATDWQAHSIRGFISGTLGKKMGLTVESTKNDAGERSYRIAK